MGHCTARVVCLIVCAVALVSPGASRAQSGAPFDVAAASTALTVVAGDSASTELTVTPAAGFAGTVDFECSGLPLGTTCAFAPPAVVPAGGPATTVLTIATTAGATAALLLDLSGAASGSALACLGAVAGAIVVRRRRAGHARVAGSMLLAAALAAPIACGGGGGSDGGSPNPPSAGTPYGTFAVTVTATSGAASATVPIALTVNAP